MNYQDQRPDMSWLSYETDDNQSDKCKKRSRITRACDICRRKKIKCELDDASECTACKQYGWECTFNVTAKKRGPPKGYIESLENRLKRMEALLQNYGPCTDTNDQQQNTAAAITNTRRELPAPPLKKRHTTDDNKIVRYLGSSSGYYLVENMLPNEVNQQPDATDQQETGAFRFRKVNVADNDILFVRDRTIAEESYRVDTEETNVHPNLIPKLMECQLVHRYFQIQHITLPVIDERPFLDSYEGRVGPPPTILLIYAICAHTCTLLQKDDPIFENSDKDRDKIYASLMDYCSGLSRREFLVPNLATIQSLILLCGFPNCSDAFYKNWIRAGMAVRMAQEMGLHRTLEKFPMSEEQFESRKRLWYCVYIIDRWICTVMGRPLAISEADCDIELPHVNGGTNGRQDYSLFNNFIKLSGILGELLRRIYSPKAKLNGYKTAATYHTVQGIHHLLNTWLSQVPDHHRISPDEATMFYKSKIQTNKVREAGPLMVCYYAVIILLYRSFIVSDKQEVFPKLLEEANQRCTEAAKNAIDVARLINPADIVCFGWSFAGFSIIQATLIHLYNCTNSSPAIAELSKQYIRISIDDCIEPLTLNGGITPQYVLPLIQTLLQLIGVDSLGNNKRPTNDEQAINSLFSTTSPSLSRSTTDSLNSSILPKHISIPSSQLLTGSSSWNKSVNSAEPEVFSAVAWQNLFSSAATPFFDAENDFQNILSTVFDENQAKQFNSTFSNSMF